jgi:hypothetical protein
MMKGRRLKVGVCMHGKDREMRMMKEEMKYLDHHNLTFLCYDLPFSCIIGENRCVLNLKVFLA